MLVMRSLLLGVLAIVLVVAIISFMEVVNNPEDSLNKDYNYVEKIPLYYNLSDNKTYTRDSTGEGFKEVEING